MRLAVALLLVISSFAFCSCSAERDITSRSPEEKVVQRAISDELHGAMVGVTIKPVTNLNLNLINSPLKILSLPQKEAKARELARVAYAKYEAREQLKSVRVAFVQLDTALVVIATNDSSDGFTFDVAELRDR